MLADLGDESAQKSILGADYSWVHGTLLGTCKPQLDRLLDTGHKSLSAHTSLERTGGQKRTSEGATSDVHLKKIRIDLD